MRSLGKKKKEERRIAPTQSDSLNLTTAPLSSPSLPSPFRPQAKHRSTSSADAAAGCSEPPQKLSKREREQANAELQKAIIADLPEGSLILCNMRVKIDKIQQCYTGRKESSRKNTTKSLEHTESTSKQPLRKKMTLPNLCRRDGDRVHLVGYRWREVDVYDAEGTFIERAEILESESHRSNKLFEDPDTGLSITAENHTKHIVIPEKVTRGHIILRFTLLSDSDETVQARCNFYCKQPKAQPQGLAANEYYLCVDAVPPPPSAPEQPYMHQPYMHQPSSPPAAQSAALPSMPSGSTPTHTGGASVEAKGHYSDIPNFATTPSLAENPDLPSNGLDLAVDNDILDLDLSHAENGRTGSLAQNAGSLSDELDCDINWDYFDSNFYPDGAENDSKSEAEAIDAIDLELRAL